MNVTESRTNHIGFGKNGNKTVARGKQFQQGLQFGLMESIGTNRHAFSSFRYKKACPRGAGSGIAKKRNRSEFLLQRIPLSATVCPARIG